MRSRLLRMNGGYISKEVSCGVVCVCVYVNMHALCRCRNTLKVSSSA